MSTHLFKAGERVVVISTTMRGLHFVESYEAEVVRPVLELAPDVYTVRIGGISFQRRVLADAQHDPAAYVASLNAQVTA
jgi:hypothetical protein